MRCVVVDVNRQMVPSADGSTNTRFGVAAPPPSKLTLEWSASVPQVETVTYPVPSSPVAVTLRASAFGSPLMPAAARTSSTASWSV